MIAICDEDDKLDPNYGPPESWPWWTDLDCYAIGPAYFITPPAAGPDPPDPDNIPVDPDDDNDSDADLVPLDPDDDFEEVPLYPDDTPAFVPAPEDVAFLLDQAEREELARFYGCNARFADDCRVG